VGISRLIDLLDDRREIIRNGIAMCLILRELAVVDSIDEIKC
jgi:hypothetical protein